MCEYFKKARKEIRILRREESLSNTPFSANNFKVIFLFVKNLETPFVCVCKREREKKEREKKRRIVRFQSFRLSTPVLIYHGLSCGLVSGRARRRSQKNLVEYLGNKRDGISAAATVAATTGTAASKQWQ